MRNVSAAARTIAAAWSLSVLLQIAAVPIAGDAAGIARATGIVTTTKRLQQLARRIAVETRARQLLSLQEASTVDHPLLL